MIDALVRHHSVLGELPGQPRLVEVLQFDLNRVHAERFDLAADIDRAIIHRVAKVLARVAADHHAPALHHEARESAGVAADDDRPALLVDAGARTDRTPAHQIAAAHGGAEGGPGVLFDQHGARHHVLAAGPADAAVDADIRSVDQANAEIAERAFENQVELRQDADAERVAPARILDDYGAVALSHQLADLRVHLRRRQIAAVDLGALVEVDVGRPRVFKPLFRVRVEFDVERLAGKLLRSHAEGGDAFLLRHRLEFGVGHARHTRTSSSYGS